MAVLESFYSSVIFLILYNFTFINHGASQDVFDYEGTIKVGKITSSRNRYFKVDGEPPNASFSVLKEIDETDRVYLVEYSTDSAGRTVKLSSIHLCDQMGQNDTSTYLTDQVFFKFLFLRQRSCPIKRDTFKVPNSMEMKFKYGYILTSNINCQPFKYRQEIRDLAATQPFLSITVNVDFKKKLKCDPKSDGESIWAKKLAEAQAQANSTKGDT